MTEPRSENILLVEDEPDLLFLLSNVLERDGLHVITANDGATALELAHRVNRIGLLITDVNIPGVTSNQLCERLLALFPAARVLLISGGGPAIIQAEHCDFLQKPFDLHQFLAKVRDLLGPPASQP